MQTQDEPKLKPCPFCGRPGQVYKNEVSWGVLEYTVACGLGALEDEPCFCSASFNHVEEFPVGWSTPEEAVKAWNKRATE